MARYAILVLALSALLAACNGESSVICTLEARAGINVSAVDSVAGTPVASATGIARDGAFAETLTSLQPGELFGAFERVGTYEVTITAPGYRPWTAEGVRVTADECHVIPVRLLARLQPA